MALAQPFRRRSNILFCLLLGNFVSFLYTTRRGKFVEWEHLLDNLHLPDDERILDIGCGRGAVLTAVARKLTTGRIAGIDIWSRKNQSGNAKIVTLQNASLEALAIGCKSILGICGLFPMERRR